VIACLVITTSIVAAIASADTSRFVPWTRSETPALSLNDPSGRVHALADYRGKVLLITFWATWCEPCRDEMPAMNALRQKLGGDGFEILAVNYGESPIRVREFLAREQLDLIALLDPNRDAAKAWRVRVLPGSFLVDAEGRVRYAVIGEYDWASDEAMRTVRAVLPTTSGARGGR
jgi:thiol-disulfide isomerase/thioredoxin